MGMNASNRSRPCLWVARLDDSGYSKRASEVIVANADEDEVRESTGSGQLPNALSPQP